MKCIKEHIVGGYKILMLILFIGVSVHLQSNPISKAPILIISSYNPDSRFVASYISNFIKGYRNIETDRPILVENMNCKTLSESERWKEYMKHILHDCSTGKMRPSMILILGQEAWSAYLSQPVSLLSGVPVMCAKVSRNTIIFPDHPKDPLSEWHLPSVDVTSLAQKYNVVGGCFNEYDIAKNVDLVKHFYPYCRNIYFITDNSCGGLCMRSLIEKQMNGRKDVFCKFLDGRKLSFKDLTDQISKIPRNSVLLIGTWRIDSDEIYFMQDCLYQICNANPSLPIFSLSQKGMGYGVIGGYVPTYEKVGESMAKAVYEYIYHPENKGKLQLNILNNQYIFDETALRRFKLEQISLPDNAQVINRADTFWDKYHNLIMIVLLIFVVLVAAFIGVTYLLVRTRRIKNNLEKSQEVLLMAKEKAEEANSMKSSFIANMSHEIRTPLNAIVGFSSIIASPDVSLEEKKEYSSVIQKNSDWLLSIVNNILDISLWESGSMSFIFQEADVVQLCKSLLEGAKASCSHQLDFVFKSPFEKNEMVIDIHRLQQILTNLLSNSCKFTEHGSVTLAYDVDQTKRLMCFSVIDTGCGIPEDKQEAVFGYFVKTDDFVQGSGLGLAICKTIIDHWNGRIWIDSDYKSGTCVRFVLPFNNVSNLG